MLGLIATSVTLSTLFTTSLSFPLFGRQTQEYHLQTKCVSCKNDTGTHKGNLYVEAYHVGAGLNDAVLNANVSHAVRGLLNGTIQQFDLQDEIPWYFALAGDDNYAAWEGVQINTFDEVAGFSFNASGLQWNATEFAGWLACDWIHGLPQLFWLDAYYNATIPTSCSKVDLVRVPI